MTSGIYLYILNLKDMVDYLILYYNEVFKQLIISEKTQIVFGVVYNNFSSCFGQTTLITDSSTIHHVTCNVFYGKVMVSATADMSYLSGECTATDCTNTRWCSTT